MKRETATIRLCKPHLICDKSIFSIYVLLKTIFYALYEIKTQENKSGGIAIIVFSIIILTFATLFIFIK